MTWGGQNGNNISIKYRDIHPSHLGYLDILVCGNSDPGTSGSLTPFTKMKSFYFDDSLEPSDFYYRLAEDLKAEYKKKGVKYITFQYDTPEEFYNALTSYRKDNKRKSQHDDAPDCLTGVYEMHARRNNRKGIHQRN